MMETVVYAREFLFIKELYDKGELGKLQFLQASHQQDMDGWPNYWPGLPPMWYATHCVGPVLALTRRHGRIRLLLRLRHHPQGAHRASTARRSPSRPRTSSSKDSDVSARIIRSLFDTARQYRESIDVYGTKKIVRVAADRARAARAAHGQAARAEDPASRSRPRTSPSACPKPSAASRRKGVYDLAKKTHLSFTQGGGHGGSHPHLVHEFVDGAGRGPRSVPERAPVRQLDLRRPVRARVGARRAARSSSCRRSRERDDRLAVCRLSVDDYRAGTATWTGMTFRALAMSLGSMRTSRPRAPALM